MVSKAIDEGLLKRIQAYVANDINSKIVMQHEDDLEHEISTDQVFILSFERILNNWTATATAETEVSSFYKLVHDGTNNLTIVTIYMIHGLPVQAII